LVEDAVQTGFGAVSVGLLVVFIAGAIVLWRRRRVQVAAA
jgi:MYXO-CTERM domain-containing protein